MAAPPDDSTNEGLENLSIPTAGGVIVDIGTGDGRFVYRSARQNPSRFYIGIDANPQPLEKISIRATRKSQKGGARNVLFLQAALEDLPPELDSIADEIHIHFPWGSLLKSVAIADPIAVRALHRLSAPGCLLEVVIGVDTERDRGEISSLNLPDISPAYFKETLADRFAEDGFYFTECGVLKADEWAHLESTWARRLSANRSRQVVYFIAEAQK